MEIGPLKVKVKLKNVRSSTSCIVSEAYAVLNISEYPNSKLYQVIMKSPYFCNTLYTLLISGSNLIGLIQGLEFFGFFDMLNLIWYLEFGF